MIIMVLFWVLIIAGGFALMRGVGPGRCGPMNMDSRHTDSALEILKRRYAGGEISKEEYEEKKRELA
jgi:putative membrane protein